MSPALCTSSVRVRKQRVVAGAPPPSSLIRDVGRDVRGGRCSQVLFSGVLSLRGSEDGVFGAGVAVA